MPFFDFSWLRAVFARQTDSNIILFELLPLIEGERVDSDLVNLAIDFWFANQRADGPPEWSCFRPERHPALLANVILYERTEGRYMTRLVGDVILDYLPKNPVGQYLDEVAAAERVADVTMRLDRTFTDALPNYVEKARVWSHSGSVFDYSVLSMPFVSRDTGVERVLCVFEFNFVRLDI